MELSAADEAVEGGRVRLIEQGAVSVDGSG